MQVPTPAIFKDAVMAIFPHDCKLQSVTRLLVATTVTVLDTSAIKGSHARCDRTQGMNLLTATQGTLVRLAGCSAAAGPTPVQAARSAYLRAQRPAGASSRKPQAAFGYLRARGKGSNHKPPVNKVNCSRVPGASGLLLPAEPRSAAGSKRQPSGISDQSLNMPTLQPNSAD